MIYTKHNLWCVRDGRGLRKFATEEEALSWADVELEAELELYVIENPKELD